MSSFKELVVIASIAISAGCASLIVGSTQTVNVNSNVSGAQVYLGDELIGTTPFRQKIKRGKNGPLVVKSPGHIPYSFSLDTSVEGAFWLNILIGGFLGSSTDSSTGAMYKYEPGTFYAELKPIAATLQDQRTFAKRAALRRFVLVNHEPLVRQIAVGEGAHLEAIFRALGIEDSRRPMQVAQWRTAYRQSTTSLDFADRLVAAAKL